MQLWTPNESEVVISLSIISPNAFNRLQRMPQGGCLIISSRSMIEGCCSSHVFESSLPVSCKQQILLNASCTSLPNGSRFAACKSNNDSGEGNSGQAFAKRIMHLRVASNWTKEAGIVEPPGPEEEKGWRRAESGKRLWRTKEVHHKRTPNSFSHV
jgi:hypothetical protein